MNVDPRFERVGIRPDLAQPPVFQRRRRTLKGKPIASVILLGVILLGCLCCEAFIPKDPTYMDLLNYSAAPNGEFWFGTDTLGRDIFSMIWYGSRISLFIGFAATAISTFIAVIVGACSGVAPKWLDTLIMRAAEILLSVPTLLIIVFVQAILGQANALSIALVIGITSWVSIAKVVRTEVRQIRASEYVVASKCMGGGFFHILRRHLAPNFISAILFMVIMKIRSAIVSESTLSFMGIGLPLEVISWGSMLSLSEKALLARSWWIILIPGAFLVVTLLLITNIGDYLRGRVNRAERNL